MQIGLYGGSFDPPHNAHLILADWVLHELHLDFIYFIPTAIHAFKNNSHLSPADIRYQMVSTAIKENDKFRVSRIELDRNSISFTVDTLRAFIKYEGLPEAKLFYIIGIDNLADFHLWKDPDLLFQLAQIVVIRRSGVDDTNLIEKYKGKVIFLESPIIDISATDIREKKKNNIDISDIVPPPVCKLIEEHELYQESGQKPE
jgi:nicotinate-nucleotide adenylyltransferase